MDYLEYLFAGFAVFWAGLFVYLLMLQFRLRALGREVEQLEERLAEQEGLVLREAADPVGADNTRGSSRRVTVERERLTVEENDS